MALPTTSNTTNPQGFGFGARLDDLLLRLAEAPGRELVIQDAEMEADRVNTAQTPEAYLSAFGDVFARADFWGGEGLRFAHRRENLENAGVRFWDSGGVEVYRQQDEVDPGIRLARTSDDLNEANSNALATPHSGALSHNRFLGGSQGKLYLTFPGNPDKYRVSTDALDTPTFADEDPYAGEAVSDGIHGTTHLALETYAALGANGIHRDPGGGPWGHWNDLDANQVWGVKRRIMAANQKNLYEVASSGAAPSPLKTLDPGGDWTDVEDVGEAILAAADTGIVYSFALNDSDTLVEQAQTNLRRETPLSMVYTQGRLFYLTVSDDNDWAVASLWRGEVSSALTIVNSQLIRSWDVDDNAHYAHRWLADSLESLIVCVDNRDSTVSLWRYVYADGSMSRIITFSSTEAMRGFVDIEGRWFTLNEDLNGSRKLFRESKFNQAEGYLIGPAGDLFTADDKSWVTAKLDATDFSGNGEEVDLFYTTNLDAMDDPTHSDWVLVKTYTASDDSEVAIQQFSRYIAGMVKLRLTGTQAVNVAVRSFAFRSYPPPGDILVDLPVNVSDQISSAGRRPRRVPGRGKEIFNELLSRSGREATLELYRHGITVTGLVERVSVPSPEVGEAGSPTAHAMLRFRGRKATLVQV